tara:strand:+ start:98 stop:223 length:126 start_codon:yes stop_codon:yes gene_type:complete
MPPATPLWRLEEAPELLLDNYVADGDRIWQSDSMKSGQMRV